MRCTFTKLFRMKYVFTYVLSPVYLDHLECLLADWQHTKLRRNCSWSMGDLRGRKTKNPRWLNEGSPITEQFCTHTQQYPPTWWIPYFTDTWFILSQSTHASPHPETTASLVKQWRLQRANRPNPCPLLIELQSVHGCPGRSWLMQVDGEKTGPYHGRRKASGLFGLIDRRASGQLLGKDWSTILLDSPSMINHAKSTTILFPYLYRTLLLKGLIEFTNNKSS